MMTRPPAIVITTCGTSILTNDVAPDQRALLIRYSNTRDEVAIPEPDRARLADHLRQRRAWILAADRASIRLASAELKGLLAWYGGAPPPAASRDLHFLIATDTFLGTAAATIAGDWLHACGLTVQVHRQRDLQTGALEPFRVALSELAQWCDAQLPAYHERGWRVVFNLTGGFKSVNGFLQAVAMLYADETVYVFEGGDELLRLPRLPLLLDANGAVEGRETVFRRLSAGLAVAPEDAVGIPETLLMEVGGEVTLSEWGRVIWLRARRQLYQERLLPAPSSMIAFGPALTDSIRGRAADRVAMVNDRMDDLCRMAESRGAYNPRSLDFKRLSANPTPPSTHECDAWSDGDAPRLFCHYEGGLLVVDRLAAGLH